MTKQPLYIGEPRGLKKGGGVPKLKLVIVLLCTRRSWTEDNNDI